MKTSKFAIIATIVSVAVMSISFSPNLQADRAVKANQQNSARNLAIDQAIQNTFLVKAMNEQLNEEFLASDQQTYIQPVLYLEVTYFITGMYEQWVVFFESEVFRASK
jgi:hypothetical protein